MQVVLRYSWKGNFDIPCPGQQEDGHHGTSMVPGRFKSQKHVLLYLNPKMYSVSKKLFFFEQLNVISKSCRSVQFLAQILETNIQRKILPDIGLLLRKLILKDFCPVLRKGALDQYIKICFCLCLCLSFTYFQDSEGLSCRGSYRGAQ